MRLSFVLPIYNVEECLDECCNSILAQVTPDCEVILVDDGSTDASGVIADQIAADRSLVKVIHKENGGLSSARNAGLDIACGDFVAFVDSDDLIARESIKPILVELEASEPDILFLDCQKLFPDGSKKSIGYHIEPSKVNGKSREDVLRYLSRLPKFPESACMKIFKRSFLERTGLRFPEDGRFSEDTIFVLKSFLAAETFSALDAPYYYYRQSRDGSITSQVGIKHFLGLQKFVEDAVDLLCDSDNKPKSNCCASCLSFAAYEYSIMLWMLGKLDRLQRSEAVEFLSSYRWLMNYAGGRKACMTRAAIKIFGARGTSALLGIYMKIR